MNIHIKNNNVDVETVDGKSFNPLGYYTLCSDNFLADGGVGFSKLNSMKYKKMTGFYVHDGLIEYIKKKGNVIDYKVDGRIVVEE